MSEEVKDLNMEELKESEAEKKDVKRDIDFILDIPVDLSVVVGSTKLYIQELLQLGQGSIIVLDKLAGEYAEVYINEKLIGKGEVVVVNEKFGVKLTSIISPAERVKQLR